MLKSAREEKPDEGQHPGGPPANTTACCRISLEAAIDLVVCGVSLGVLNLLAAHLQPGFPHGVLWTGLVGGVLCILWGTLGRRGKTCRTVAMTTLAMAAWVFARQAVLSWTTSPDGGSKHRLVAALMAVLVIFCVGVLLSLWRERKKLEP